MGHLTPSKDLDSIASDLRRWCRAPKKVKYEPTFGATHHGLVLVSFQGPLAHDGEPDMEFLKDIDRRVRGLGGPRIDDFTAAPDTW